MKILWEWQMIVHNGRLWFRRELCHGYCEIISRVCQLRGRLTSHNELIRKFTFGPRVTANEKARFIRDRIHRKGERVRSATESVG